MDDTIANPALQPALLGERRHVSVLFADMVGYTAIIERVGEERALAFTRMAYGQLTGAVRAHGGAVRGFGGDSIMAVFGVPDAQEDTALRACRAALAILQSFATAAEGIEARFGVRPDMRVGVSSGGVVMARVEGDDAPLTAVGNAVNLASRIQALAPDGGCLICDVTRRQMEWQADLAFAGEHRLKGVAQPQKLWRLRSVHDGASRFDASLARGLTRFIGRDAELSALMAALQVSRDGLRVCDIVAEPGLGKTRLVHEFLQRTGSQDALVLRGHCAPDGQRAPFFPFLEMLRSLLGLHKGDDRATVLRKLESGLEGLGLAGAQNLGLLANLLGLDPPEGALAGLDGVLTGLRTRDLVPAVLAARCRAGPVVVVLEDIHWIDGASVEVARALVEGAVPANLLLVVTRRPEYAPGWTDRPAVRTLALGPLSRDDIRDLAQTRLEVDSLPDALLQQVAERAGGNPLFGEEILRYLLETGALRVDDGRVAFDDTRGQGDLPVTLQTLLTARIDGLARADRAVLQAAAAIGRRFDADLLAQAMPDPDACGPALARLRALGLVHREAGGSEHVFKHALLRDCVYQGLVRDSRAALHLAIARAIEARDADRLPEAAEALAYHYALTDRHDQAFRFNALAGAKSLGVFSLDGARRYFARAHALYRADPGCAGDSAFAAFLADYALCLNLSLRVPEMLALAQEVAPFLQRLGDSGDHVLFLHHYLASLIWNAQYRAAHNVVADRLRPMADRLDAPRAQAYALVSELAVSCYDYPDGPLSLSQFEALRRRAEAAVARIDDAYLQNFFLAHVGWNDICRGRVRAARAAADRMIADGRSGNDPRALGYGTAMHALTAMLSADYAAALELSDRALALSRVPFERAIAASTRHVSLMPLNRPGAVAEVEAYVAMCRARGWGLFQTASHGMLGVAMAMNGRIGAGMAHLRAIIAESEALERHWMADWCRLLVCEIHLGVMAGQGGTSARVVLGNLRTLAHVALFGEREVTALIARVRSNPLFDPDGHLIAQAEMILGLMYKARRKPALARRHLLEARRIVAPAGASAMLARIDAGLEGLAP